MSEVEGDAQELRWTCHICGRSRPDAKISVAKHTHVDGYGHERGENVRYCNDSADCEQAAKLTGHIEREGRRRQRVLQEDLSDARERIILWVCGSAVVAMIVGLLCGLVIGSAS